MNAINRFTLSIKDPKILTLYRENNYTKVIRTGIVLTIIRVGLYIIIFSIASIYPGSSHGKIRFYIWQTVIIILQIIILILIKIFK